MSISVFLPTRKGSERIKNKNTRKFAEFEGGLLELKLRQLAQLNVDEVILSTNDEESIAVGKSFQSYFPKLTIDIRPDYLAQSKTSLSDLIDYVPKVTSAENILWTHVTSPMVSTKVYEDSIKDFYKGLENGFDSLMSVTAFQNFLWKKELNDIINRKGQERWPKTQDLDVLYEINSAIFICPREIYKNNNDRVGKNPNLFEMDKLISVDVDWEEDFKIAEALYEKFGKL
ncbi:acylneuraminate cytidylyltransferase family protein [Salinimicrobium soli]|uniref:acylneuraminate cytidylyltransferase family protein n=1 Tax=Salinimicrobium soli TaxID=1254399 RepID=UPI003AAB7829